MDFDSAISYTIGFFTKNKFIRVGRHGFNCADLLAILVSDSEDDATDELLGWSTEGFSDGYITTRAPMAVIPKESLEGSSLDLLALAFTIVKMFYSMGKLDKLPALFRLIEPTRLCSIVPLHETNIRNEAAYYCCIARVLVERFKYGSKPLQDYSQAEAVADKRKIFVCGDSHILPLSWASTPNPLDTDQEIILIPKIVTGVKQWHLRPESNFYPKANFYNAVKTIPDGSEVKGDRIVSCVFFFFKLLKNSIGCICYWRN
jgi:hypothetical protein